MWSHDYYHANRTPPGFPNAETLPGSTLWSDLEIWHDKRSKASNGHDTVIIPTKMKISKSPTLLCAQGVKDLYVNSEYEKIKVLQQKIRADVEGVDKLIRDGGVNVFRVIETPDKQQRYYVAYDATASVWIYPVSKKPKSKSPQSENDEARSVTKYTSVFQLGKYSSATDVAGTVDFKFQHTASDDISCFLVAKIVEKVQSTLQEDIPTDIILQFLVNHEIVYELDRIDWGGKIEKYINNSGLATSAATTAIEVLGAVFYWAFKKYSIKLGILNWCSENSLFITEFHSDNALMLQVENDIIDHHKTILKIPKAPTFTPPLFEPLVPFGAACHYATMFFANKLNFFKGCGFGLKMEINKPQTDRGFFYAFDCKRFKNNRQKLDEISESGSLEQYYSTPEWNANPLKFMTFVGNIPLAITLNALNCSRDRYYPIINFGYKNQ